jgi:peptidoglycan L-alanyl-D-glutamate endopeptidase CwlK
MYKFGNRSEQRMLGVRRDLAMCARKALIRSKYDMTIPWMGGVRTAEQQKRLFESGSTKADGYDKKSYHQTGNALDIIPTGREPYKNTKVFNHFAALMFVTWQALLLEGKASGELYWGGHFGADGWDKPHFEIR